MRCYHCYNGVEYAQSLGKAENVTSFFLKIVLNTNTNND